MTTTRRTRNVSLSPGRLTVDSVENLLCAGLVLGLFVTSLSADAFGGSSLYRTLGLAVAGCLIGAAVIAGLAPKLGTQEQGGPGRDSLVLLAAAYFVWSAAQDYLLQSDLSGAVQAILGLLVVYGALAADRQRMIAGLRRWLLVAVVALLIPALLNQGFEAGERVWLGFLPGRYFGLSNPNALAFLAGVAVLVAIPVLRRGRGWPLATLAAVLVILTAGNTTAVAIALALLAYLGLSKVRTAGFLKAVVAAFALLTPAMLLWLQSDGALRLLVEIQTRFDLSGRSFLWAHLVRSTRDSDTFWTGMGDQRVAYYTTHLLNVSSAHSTILQMFLSEGFFTTVAFVLVAAVATIRILNAWASERTGDARIAFAVVVYWFVVSLTSTQPSTGLGFSIILALAVAGSRTPRYSAA